MNLEKYKRYFRPEEDMELMMVYTDGVVTSFHFDTGRNMSLRREHDNLQFCLLNAIDKSNCFNSEENQARDENYDIGRVPSVVRIEELTMMVRIGSGHEAEAIAVL